MTAAALGAAALGGLASAGAAAQASATPAPVPAPMMAGDRDGDGISSRDEAAADADRRFAAMDANHDGKLTADERRAWREQHRPPPRRAGASDRRDEAQTQADFRDRALRRFDRIDTNRDGRIDAREREAAMLLMRARRIGHDRPVPPADPAAPTD